MPNSKKNLKPKLIKLQQMKFGPQNTLNWQHCGLKLAFLLLNCPQKWKVVLTLFFLGKWLYVLNVNDVNHNSQNCVKYFLFALDQKAQCFHVPMHIQIRIHAYQIQCYIFSKLCIVQVYKLCNQAYILFQNFYNCTFCV